MLVWINIENSNLLNQKVTNFLLGYKNKEIHNIIYMWIVCQYIQVHKCKHVKCMYLCMYVLKDCIRYHIYLLVLYSIKLEQSYD